MARPGEGLEPTCILREGFHTGRKALRIRQDVDIAVADDLPAVIDDDILIAFHLSFPSEPWRRQSDG